MPIRVPMHLVHHPETRTDLVADGLGKPWRWEGQGLTLAIRQQVLEHLARPRQLALDDDDPMVRDGGDEVTLPATSMANLCSGLLGLGGAVGVVVLWGETVGLPVQAAK